MTIADSRVVLSEFFAGKRNSVGDYWAPCMAKEAHESLLAEAESRADKFQQEAMNMTVARNALQSRLDTVVGLADALIERASQHASSSELCADPINKEWHSGMSEGIDDCANEIRSAALGGESPANEEELK